MLAPTEPTRVPQLRARAVTFIRTQPPRGASQQRAAFAAPEGAFDSEEDSDSEGRCPRSQLDFFERSLRTHKRELKKGRGHYRLRKGAGFRFDPPTPGLTANCSCAGFCLSEAVVWDPWTTWSGVLGAIPACPNRECGKTQVSSARFTLCLHECCCCRFWS